MSGEGWRIEGRRVWRGLSHSGPGPNPRTSKGPPKENKQIPFWGFDTRVTQESDMDHSMSCQQDLKA